MSMLKYFRVQYACSEEKEKMKKLLVEKEKGKNRRKISHIIWYTGNVPKFEHVPNFEQNTT